MTPPDSPKPAARPHVEVLHEDEGSRFELCRAAQPADTLAITFDPLQQLASAPAFARDLLLKQGVDVLTVRRLHEHFYQALGRETFVGVVSPLLGGYRRVVAYGSSLGAYAGLYYCRDLRCIVIASSPRLSVHPVYGVEAWQERQPFRHQRFDRKQPAACQAIIFYDPKDPLDRPYVEGEILPQFPEAQVVRLPYSGHPSNHFLSEIGYIAPFVRAVVAGRRPPARDRSARHRSPTYLCHLAHACAQHGRHAAAEVLLARAEQLRPEASLVFRTRGWAGILRGDEAAARTALQRAVELSPGDHLSSHLLETLPAQIAKARRERAGRKAQARGATAEPRRPSALRRVASWFTGAKN